MTDLAGRHALVTGGGTGIGLAIARELARAGAEVTIAGRRRGPLEAAAAARIHPARIDVTDEAELAREIDRAVAARGPLAICVANAGIAEGRSLLKTDMAFWRQMMAVNLDGAFLTIRELLRSMRDLDYGRIIAVASIAGIRGLRGAPAYSASKHGMVGLVRGLSEDLIGTKVTANALCPAYVDTEIVARNVGAIRDRAAVSEDRALEIMVSQNRHGRLIDAGEVARAALWLCDAASGSVNGQAIEIAGGQA